jgi:hypothetical protein
MSDSPIFLTVRGTLNNPDLEQARVLHNETAGSQPGIAAARALGDLSHKVYAPSGKLPGAGKGELLFLDNWQDPKGLMEFFSNAHVQQQGGRLFSSRDATVWMPARGAFTWNLPAARGRDARFVGMLRAPISSPEKAIELFAAVDKKVQRDARRRGQLSHDLYIKLNPPGVDAPLELLGVDIWSDGQGMVEHYSDRTHMPELAVAFSGPPATSVWEEPAGVWSEW